MVSSKAVGGHSDSTYGFKTLVQMVQYQAKVRPDKVALIFLPDGEVEVGRLTYAELDRRARAFAARLQAEGLSGESVLLMLPSSTYYVIAFLGCLYAKAIPVPAYPPTSGMHAERLAHIVSDCNAKGVILTTVNQQVNVQSRLGQFLPEGLTCSYLAVDELNNADEANWIAPDIAPDGLAYLQYTSGSTSRPRGVMVTHGNLLAYCASWQASAQQDHTDVFVTWLPLFHDMGLIMGVVQPLFVGATIVMMPPPTFLQRPLRWLMAISRYRGTASFAPNFAYELCAATLDEVQRKALDLSSWSSAGNGAEPVRADTLSRFAERFASCGFRQEAMNPFYGLAETTLSVVQRAKLEVPLIRMVDAEALKLDLFLPVLDSSIETRPMVSCGRAWLDINVIAVKPDSCRPCESSEIGEIWVAGPIVARGYWNQPEATAATFDAYLSNGDGPFLRTGDLGALYQGEIYITGRIKDVIVIRGQNHYPQDIEQTVFRSHTALEAGYSAAFSVEVGGVERLVVAQEVRRSRRKKFDGADVVEAVRAAIAERHGLALYAFVLLSPASIQITSSGKIQRKACKHNFLNGLFDPLHTWREGQIDSAMKQAASAFDPASSQSQQAIASWLAQAIAHKKSIPLVRLQDDVAFTSFGIDSMELVALSDELAVWLDRPVVPMALYDYPTITSLAQYLSGAPVETRDGPKSADAAEPIAIVGMGCRFPGAESVEAFWRLLDAGVDAIGDIPASRWDAAAYYEEGAAPSAGKMNTRWGGFIDGADEFDAQFFGISPREMQSMDPQQRLVLSVTWHALENAGIAPDALAGSNTGVFIGATHGDYRSLLSHAGAVDAYNGTGNVLCILANRVSYLLDLHGPSFVVDTACSSSFVALHQARMSLLAGECAVAIVGGVNLMLAAETTVATSQAHMLSADGHCKAFDASADGYVRSEGCGIVILKRHADALRDNNRILGLIAGSALNQDGKSNGLTAPNGIAQQAVIRRALASAGVPPARVSYVEAHGTGTSLGDPIEVAALKHIYGEVDGTGKPVWIGSVKTNIGHLEAASGMAGLIKVVLSMQHQKIPRHLHLQTLNPLISLDGSRCAIPVEAQAWPREEMPRLAGISSFGFGGANAHVIVQEAPVDQGHGASTLAAEPLQTQLLVLSAKSSSVLRAMAQQYADFLAADGIPSFANICHTAAAHRAHYGHRLALAAQSKQAAAALLLRYAKGEEVHGISSAHSSHAPAGALAFLFTGQGSQYAGMGYSLYQNHAGFRATLQQCDAILQPLLGLSLLSILYASELKSTDTPVDLTQTLYAQPALFAVEYALAKTWQSAGAQPDYLIGHSLGEYVAACIAGVFSLRDGLTLVAHRARLMQEQAELGAMTAIRAPIALLTRLLDQFKTTEQNRIAVAVYNSPEDIVLSGDPAEVTALAERWVAQGATATPLQVTRAFHSPLMSGMVAEFERHAKSITYHAPQIPIISNLSGNIAGPEIAGAEYWVRHVLEPVCFAQGLQTLAATACKTMVEIGPHPVLSALGQQAIAGASWLPSLRRGGDAEQHLLHSVGQWFASGHAVDWLQWAQTRSGADVKLPQPVSLPYYPFQRDRFWFKPGTAQNAATSKHGKPLHPLLGRKLNLAVNAHCFENLLSAQTPWFIPQHQVFGVPVLPAAALIETALAALQAAAKTGPTHWTLENLAFSRAMVLAEDQPTTLQTTVEAEGDVHDQTWRVRLVSTGAAEPDGEWVEHGTLTAKAALVQAPIHIALDTLKETLSLQAIDTYAQFRQLGLEYGPAFQGVKQLWANDKQALALINVPEAARDGAAYTLHPLAIDSCFHTLIAFLNPNTVTDETAVLPVGINQLRINPRLARNPLPHQLWCHVTWHGEQSPGRYLSDLELCSGSGESLVSIQGLHLAKVQRASVLASLKPVQELDCYQIEWQAHAVDTDKFDALKSTPPTTAADTGPSTCYLIYAADPAQARDWQSQFSALCIPAVAISSGVDFRRLTQTAFSIDPVAGQDVARLFMTLTSEQIRVRGLLYCGDRVDPLGSVDIQVIEATYRLAQSSSTFLKTFLNTYSDGCPDIIICTHGACVVKPNTNIGALDAPTLLTESGLAQSVLCGMVKSIVTEYPRLKCVQVDLDPESETAAHAVLAAFVQLPGSGHIAWRALRCYEARLHQKKIAALTNPVVQIRADATYLITGGMGGIGLAAAEWLVQQGARALVLLGRSIPTSCADSIRQMEATGATVALLQVDVADPAALVKVSAYIENHLPPLRGVVHSAGVNDDAPMSELDWARFSKVMAPKVRGAWNLHRFTEQCDLDFFALFSSMVSMIGAAGSSSYVVSNLFMDSLASYRRARNLPAVSINWGAWAQTGMAANRNLLEHFEHEGVQGIETHIGLQALAAVLAPDATQIGVSKIDWTRYKEANPRTLPYTWLTEVGVNGNTAVSSSATYLRKLSDLSTYDADTVRDLVSKYLFHSAVRVLRLDVARQTDLQPAFLHAQLNALGFDSLMAVELRNRIAAEIAVDVPIRYFIGNATVEEMVALLHQQMLLKQMTADARNMSTGETDREVVSL
ncbi:MAG: type I polyketide synthase [Pseudomonadota bacterium]